MASVFDLANAYDEQVLGKKPAQTTADEPAEAPSLNDLVSRYDQLAASNPEELSQKVTQATTPAAKVNSNFTQNALMAGAENFESNFANFSIVKDKLFEGTILGSSDEEILAKADEANSSAALAEVYANANGVKSFESLMKDGTSGDWGNYLMHNLIQVAPEVAATVAGAVSTGAVLPAIAAPFMRKQVLGYAKDKALEVSTEATRRLAEKKAKQAAQDIARDRFVKRAGQLSGALAVTYPQRTGETYAFTGDAAKSALVGAPMALVDIFAEVALIRAMGKSLSGQARKQAQNRIVQIGKDISTGALQEGIAEKTQTELQLIAKKWADPSFDFFGDSANMQRLESLIVGGALGGAVRGTTSAVGAVASTASGMATDFKSGARQAEAADGMVPETAQQLQTQLLELRQGRGREAVVKTDGPLSPDDLAQQGLQQVELAEGQGVLITRIDQNIDEIKAAFESGERDVLGNGTVNKPEGGTEVVRSVNSDGSRGADVVVTPDTEAAVTTAQENKSDIGQTEKITAEQAIGERAQMVDDQIQFEDLQDNSGDQQTESASDLGLTEQVVPEIIYGSGGKVFDTDLQDAINQGLENPTVMETRSDGTTREVNRQPSGYQTMEALKTAMDRMVAKRTEQAVLNEEQDTGNPVSDERKAEIAQDVQERFEVRSLDSGFYIVETAAEPMAYAENLVSQARGASEINVQGKGVRVKAPDLVQQWIDGATLTKKTIDAFRRVIGLRDRNGGRVLLDIGVLARAGARKLAEQGEMQGTMSKEDFLRAGLQQALGDLYMEGYRFDEQDVADGLGLDGTKQIGSNNPIPALPGGQAEADFPNPLDFKDEDGNVDNTAFLRAFEEYKNKRDYAYGKQIEEQESSANDPTTEEYINESMMFAEEAAAREEQQARPNMDAEYRRAAQEGRQDPLISFGSMALGVKRLAPNMKALLGGKHKKSVMAIARLLREAVRLTGKNILIVDNDGARKILDDPKVDDAIKQRVRRAVENNNVGTSMYPTGKDFGIVFVNTDLIYSQFEGAAKPLRDATLAWTVMHELGHQFYRNSWESLSKEDMDNLQEVFWADDSHQHYLDAYEGDLAKALNEWFADRMAAYGMKQLGGVASNKGYTEDTPARKAVNKLLDKFMNTLTRMYNVWRRQFLDGKGILKGRQYSSHLAYAESSLFNEWLEYVTTGQKARSNLPVVYEGGQPQTARQRQEQQGQPQPEGRTELPVRREADPEQDAFDRANEFREEDYIRFRFFGEWYDVPRNRLQWERAFKAFKKWGVGSAAGKLFFSAHTQLKQFGTPGRRLANMLYKLTSSETADGYLQKALYEHQQRTGQLYEILPSDPEQMLQVLDDFAIWRENGADLADIPDSIRPYHRQLTEFFDDMQAYLAEADPNFTGRENYFPHTYDLEALKNPAKAQALAQLLLEKHPEKYSDINAAYRAVEALQNNLHTLDVAPDSTAPTASNMEQRTWTNLTYSDLRSIGILHNPRTAVFKYVRESTKSAEFHKTFGGMYNNEYKADAAILRELDRMTPDERAEAEVLLDAMLGKLGAKYDPSNGWGKVQSWLMTVQFLATLTFATLASFPDVMMPALRAREFNAIATNAKIITKMIMDTEYREGVYEQARVLGTITNDVINEAIISGYGGEYLDPKARSVSDWYFKTIQLERWTRMSRVIATSMGREFLIKHATENTPRGIRYMDELGVNGEQVRAWIDSGYDYSTPDGQAVQRAIMRFTEESIMRPNSAERPTYMSDPRFMLIAQLKGFYYSMGHKVVGGIAREMKARKAAGEPMTAQMAPMLMAGVALMPLAALALAIREELKYEDGREPTNRMSTPEYLFELVSRSGFLGPLEIPRSMFQAEQYGLPFWAAPLGPTVATGFDMVTDTGFDGISDLIPVANWPRFN